MRWLSSPRRQPGEGVSDEDCGAGEGLARSDAASPGEVSPKVASEAEANRRYLVRQVPFVIWGHNLACGAQQSLPASHRDMFNTLLPLAGNPQPA